VDFVTIWLRVAAQRNAHTSEGLLLT
jgi:hypothetical protein